MSSTAVGLINPGEMGSRVAMCLRQSGHEVLWASQDRSDETRARAERAQLTDVGTIAAVAKNSDLVLSILPPHAAIDLARVVAGRTPLFVDANAVSPGSAAEMARTVEGAGGAFVDGGIIGGPPEKPGTTRLFLSGERAPQVAALFSSGPLEVLVIDGSASALKMCYAAWTKGTDALLLAILAVARGNGVDEALLREWQASQPSLLARSRGAGLSAGRKGWRFVGEMAEIASTFASTGLPSGFHQAAGEVFERVPRDPAAEGDDDTLQQVIAGLLGENSPPTKSATT